VQEILCFGWIDGIVRTVDANRYVQRITPRRPGSNWSNINVAHVAELKRLGLMMPAGLRAFEARTAKKTGVYAFENRPRKLPPAYEKRLKGNAKAWAFFAAQPPGYRRLMAFFVMDARKEETRLKRLDRLIKDSAAGRRVGMLERPAKRRK
jgi:uncharacterized protein YdeI (YjbR/CyaY-like superfamily)